MSLVALLISKISPYLDKAEMALATALYDDPAKPPRSYRILERQKVFHYKDGAMEKFKQLHPQASV